MNENKNTRYQDLTNNKVMVAGGEGLQGWAKKVKGVKRYKLSSCKINKLQGYKVQRKEYRQCYNNYV